MGLEDKNPDTVRDLLREMDTEMDFNNEEKGNCMAAHFEDFSAAEKALIEKLTAAVLKKALEDHEKHCPVKIRFVNMLFLSGGIAIGSGVVSAGLTAMILKAAAGG